MSTSCCSYVTPVNVELNQPRARKPDLPLLSSGGGTNTLYMSSETELPYRRTLSQPQSPGWLHCLSQRINCLSRKSTSLLHWMQIQNFPKNLHVSGIHRWYKIRSRTNGELVMISQK